jgi:probable rRNA maturation factor
MGQLLELRIIGDVPEALELKPVEDVVSALILRSEEIGLPNGEVNLSFVDDVEIRRLNLEYTGNDYSTDVLSFCYLESGGPIDEVIGEMAISIDTAARQAVGANMALSEEVALLALHGILHISGFDHQTPYDQERMQELQKTIMSEAKLNYREFKWEQ